MLRIFLDRLYLGSGALGAFFLALIGIIMLLQMIARSLGMQLRGADDLTAWSVASTAMLSLAYAFRHGAHIRVTLLIGSRKGKTRKVYELICLASALTITMLLTYASFRLAYDSWQYQEMAQGLLQIPIWIPQISLVAGAGLFCVAILDDLVSVLLVGKTSYSRYEDAS